MTKQTQKYPEHEKLQVVKDKSQSIGNFLEWIRSTKNLHIAKWIDVEYENVNPITNKKTTYTREELWIQPYDVNKLLAEYFNIDLKKLEEEKQQMLTEIRKLSEKEET